MIPFSFFKGTGLLAPIFITIAGQSNARGQGTPFPAEYQGDILNGEIWNGTAFETLNGSVDNNNQFGQAQGTFGMEMSLIKDLLTRHSAVYCMKYAIGSSGLASVAQGGSAGNWNPATVAEYFDTLVAEANQAIALLPSGYIDGGFFWYQGEADSLNATVADLYHTNLTTFITDYRTETSQPTKKFYIVRILNITDNGAALQSPTVRLAETKYTYDNYGNSYLINVDDLGIEADFTHLTATGYVDLGLRASASLATPPDQKSICLSDDFSTIANKNWLITGTGITASSGAAFTQAHAGTIAFDTGRKITCRYVMPSGLGNCWGRMKMSWTDPVQTLESSGGFLFYIDVNNYVGVMTDAGVAGGNAIRIRKRLASTNTDTPVAAVNGDEFKIKYNTATGAYEIFYWTAGAWSSLGTGTGAVGRGRFICTTNDSVTFTGGDVYTFQEFDFTIADFTTRRPTL